MDTRRPPVYTLVITLVVTRCTDTVDPHDFDLRLVTGWTDVGQPHILFTSPRGRSPLFTLPHVRCATVAVGCSHYRMTCCCCLIRCFLRALIYHVTVRCGYVPVCHTDGCSPYVGWSRLPRYPGSLRCIYVGYVVTQTLLDTL